eukprot:4622904-Amphidinium_carterae.1
MVLRRLKTIEIVAKTEDPSKFHLQHACSCISSLKDCASMSLPANRCPTMASLLDQLWHAWDQYAVPDLAQTIAVKVLFCMCFGVIPLLASGTCLHRTKTLSCLL